MINVYEAVDANKRKSWLIIAGFILFISLASYFISQGLGYFYGFSTTGLEFLGLGLIISGVSSFISYYYSDQIILSISGARPADRQVDFHFFTAAENISIAAGIPTPRLYVIEDSALNAFATGRDPQHAVICATSGLIAKLDRTELEGVVAHEMAHIINYDIRLMSIVTVLVGLITLLADWLLRSSFHASRGRDSKHSSGAIPVVIGIVLALLSPIIAQLIQLAISRRREYTADAMAVKLTRQPSGLIGALTKLAGDAEPLEAANKATAHLYIVNPLKNHSDSIGWFAGLFNTHPPVTDRITVLKQMS